MPADDYIASFENAQDAFISEVDKLEEDGLSAAEILAILASINMAIYFLEDLGMSSAVSVIDADILAILDSLPAFGKVTELQLTSIQKHCQQFSHILHSIAW